MKPFANFSQVPFTEGQLYFIPLGGSGEIGMNFNVYYFDDQYLIVDVGITFADDSTPPGIDVICPELSALRSVRDQIVGIVITHAHEDHVGALHYLWNQLKAPVYCTPFTASVARRKLGEAGLLDQVPLHEVLPRSLLELGGFELEWVTLTHSIPEPNALVIKAAGRTVFHTGDWKLDPHPIEGEHYDDGRLLSLGDSGIEFVIGDSTNATVHGWSGSESECRNALLEVIGSQPNRVAVTCFSSNTARLASLGDIAQETGRRITVLGRSLFNYLQTAKATGYLKNFPDLVPTEDLDYLPKSEQLILATGSQGEPKAAMARLAKGEHQDLLLEPDDTVVFSSKVIPGNEKKLYRLYDLLSQKKVRVITEQDAPIHVSGHPCRDELRWMYRALRPNFVIPVHGEERHMASHSKLADEMGLGSARVVNGDVLHLDSTGVDCIARVQTGRLGVSGSSLIPLNDRSLSERRALADGGLVTVTVVLGKRARLATEPQVRFVGVPSGDIDPETLNGDLRYAIEAMLSEQNSATLQSDDALRSVLQREIGTLLCQWLGVKPKQLVNIVRL
ncbi:ribonuclease J [Litorivicinus sp.]|nr:ribonuclease J [Litorivicinus sp.]